MGMLGMMYQLRTVGAAHGEPRFLLSANNNGKYLLQLFSADFMTTSDLLKLLKQCRPVGLLSYERILDDSVFSPLGGSVRLISGIGWSPSGYLAGLYSIANTVKQDKLVDCLLMLIKGYEPKANYEFEREVVFGVLISLFFIWLIHHIVSHSYASLLELRQENAIELVAAEPELEQIQVEEDVVDESLLSSRMDVLETKLSELKISESKNIKLQINIKVLQDKMDKFVIENKCPIDQSLMDDPITMSSGHTFNKKAILGWLKTDEKTCPATRIILLENKKVALHTDVFRKGYIIKKLTKLERSFTLLAEKKQPIVENEARKKRSPKERK